ncbi:unnamed protein product [Phytophthora lilii]|uniref:Unnamed protein product n=1 Tax=Phytophthora lilii TaxID=2077276 RepID=A0A9W6U9W6_9STRA|nr:unnamed protein product [Phytophthora lilii]
MKFFLLTNPHSLLNTQSQSSPEQLPLGSRGFPLKTPLIGPKRPPGLRRRRPKSKNSANAKKAEANARKRNRQLEKEAKHIAAELQEQIRQLDRQLMLMSERELQVRRSTQDAAYHVMEIYFSHIARGIDPVRFPVQAQATKTYLMSTFDPELKSPDYTGLDQFIDQWQLLSQFHSSIECQVSSIEVNTLMDGNFGDEDEGVERHVTVVKTHGSTTLQVSRTTIERVFPHILNDEELVQWLIGKKYSFSFNLFAYVDAISGRVFQIESKVDLTWTCCKIRL